MMIGPVVLWLCSMFAFPILASPSNYNLYPDFSWRFSSEVVKKESFVDWAHWKDKYPQCNPENNANTAPIKINSDNIVTEPSMKALFVHSRMPVDDCLALTILYKEGNLEMEAVSIMPLPGCSHQLTQIYLGHGTDFTSGSKKYFKRAVLFFTENKPEKERSLHKINGQQYPAEILMEFVSSNKKDYAQVFILVDVQPPDKVPANPIFTVLEPALQELKQEVVDEASMKTERALKFKLLQDACSENEEKHVKIQEATKYIIDKERLKTLEKIIRSIKGITNEDLNRLSDEDIFWKSSNGIIENIQKLEEQRSTLYEMMQNETEPWAFDKLHNLYVKVENVLSKLENDRNGNLSKLERIKSILKANKVGVPGESPFPGMLYDSPDAVHVHSLDITRRFKEYNRATRLYNESCQEFVDFQKQPYALVRINQPFQISWLLPHTGGYYLYNGSNPIPACEPRNTTIVLKEPIIISSEQLRIFQDLPSLEKLRSQAVAFDSFEFPMPNQVTDNGDWKVDKMIPILNEGDTSRKIWYVPKNTVFLNDDGFHRKSARVRQSPEINSGETLPFSCAIVLYLVAISLVQKYK